MRYRLIALLLVIWAILIIRIGAPWYGIQEAPRIWVHAAIRNIHHYGIEDTGMMVTWNMGPSGPGEFVYYSHHPPTVVWFPYFLTHVMGDSEFTVRYVFIASTLLGACAFFVLVRRLYGQKVAFWATAIYGLVPMMAYYGRVPGHDELTMTVAMLYAAITVNWLRRPTRARLIALGLLAWMAVWTAWTGVFFIAIIGLAAMWLGDRGHKLSVIGFGVISVVAFLTMMIYYQLNWDGSINSILEAFGIRSSNADPGGEVFSVFEFIWVTAAHIAVFITVGVSVMSIWGINIARKYGSRFANTILLALFLSAFVYQMVFLNASFVHIYYKLTLVPSMAITAALAWVYVRSQQNKRRWIKPFIYSLMIVSVINATGVIIWMHSLGNRPDLQTLIDVVNEQAAPADKVSTHLAGRGPIYPLSFYTYRNVAGEQSFEDTVRQSAISGNRIIYISCPLVDDEIDSDVPPGEYETIPAGPCELAFIDSSN